MHLFNVKKVQKAKGCVCSNHKECLKISRMFAAIEDARGGFVTFPKPLKDNDKRVKMKEQQTQLIAQIVRWILTTMPLSRDSVAEWLKSI